MGCEFTRDGAQLSRRDAETWAEAVILTAIVWSDLYESLSTRLLTSWCKRVAHLDVVEVCSVMKDADFLLTRFWEDDDRCQSYEQFKTCLYTTYAHCGHILGPLRRGIEEFFFDPEIETYRKLHQALAFIGRVTLRDYDDADAFQRLKEHDEALVISDWALVARLNTILREWLDGFSVGSVPQHGPGSVADSKSKSLFAKYQHIALDQLLCYVIRKYYVERICTRGDIVPPFGDQRTFERVSLLRQVPKNALKRRNICMETCTLQFYQQMVKTDLYAWLDMRLSQRIKLRDQSRNRNLAREGSVSGTLSTIDLSAASDSVQWDLVRTAFRGTSLLPWLYATRSRKIANGERGDEADAFIPKMFAPMGSLSLIHI